MKQETITLRCKDEQEAVVFHRYDYEHLNTYYELAFEDSYIGGDYRGFFGRIRRAWKSFWDKPVVYTGIYCDDKEKIRKFLTNCLALVDNIEETPWEII